MNPQPMHEALKPLAWLEGKWRVESPGSGKFPTIKPFSFCEELEFTSVGQPMFNYVAQGWNPESKKPMHREVGFLKVIPGTSKVSLILAHNFGLATIEEGEYGEAEIKCTSTNIARISKGCKDPAVTKIEREFKLVGAQLQQTLRMATTKTTELTEHLRRVYVKVNGDCEAEKED